jgi:putative protease
MAPVDAKIEEVDNEYGSVIIEEGIPYLVFKKLEAENKKIWDEVHSGNVNPIKLPVKMPQYTFFRIPAGDEINQAPQK